MSSQRTKILHEIASNYRKSEVSIRKSQTSNQQIDHEHLTIAHHRKVVVDGKSHKVICQDVQFHPVSDAPLHVDFLRK